MPRESFTVWVWMTDDWHFPVAEHVDAERAVRYAKHSIALAERQLPGAPRCARVSIVANADDTTCFLWERGKGIVYPTREHLAEAAP